MNSNYVLQFLQNQLTLFQSSQKWHKLSGKFAPAGAAFVSILDYETGTRATVGAPHLCLEKLKKQYLKET